MLFLDTRLGLLLPVEEEEDDEDDECGDFPFAMPSDDRLLGVETAVLESQMNLKSVSMIGTTRSSSDATTFLGLLGCVSIGMKSSSTPKPSDGSSRFVA